MTLFFLGFQKRVLTIQRTTSIKRYFISTGCPTSNYTASMGLKYDLGDKLENLRTMNHFEKFDKTNRIFFCREC